MSLWYKILIWILPVLFAVTVHEVAHAWLACKLGDKTAHDNGRLSLNPLKHVDLFGSIVVPGTLLVVSGFVFGWAKPVPIDVQQLDHPKRDMGLVALAGPLANLLMLVLWALLMKLGLAIMLPYPVIGAVLVYMGAAGILINAALMMLNLLPLPPLDGGRVLTSLLPSQQAIWLLKFERWGLFILFILLISGMVTKIIWPLMVFPMALVTQLLNIPTDTFTSSLSTLLN